MNIKLFDKTSSIQSSSIYLAYRVLNYFNNTKKKKETIYRLIKQLSSDDNQSSYKQLSYALIFLYSCDLIEFNVPDIILKDKSKLF